MSLQEDSNPNGPEHGHESLSHLDNPSRPSSQGSLFDPGHAQASISDTYTAPVTGDSGHSLSRGDAAPLDCAPSSDYDHFFHEAYQPALPSPPLLTTFLDNILNPASLDHNRFSPFDYHPHSPSWPAPALFPNAMLPSTRTNPDASGSRSGRLSNGYVDLTAATVEAPPQLRKREASDSGPSAKRQRRADGTAGSRKSPVSLDIEEVDLTEEQPSVRDVLQKQREDAIKAQTKPDEMPTTFNTLNCVICMDTPTDLTATACGHLFCHTCLMEALIAGENRSGPGEQKRSQCPVCRKFINRTKATDIIPLALKKGRATQPRRKAAA